MKMWGTARKSIKPIEYRGTLWYQCASCGEWTNHIETLTNDQMLFENIWDEQHIDQMMGIGTYCTITINNITKPFVCACCWLWECGYDEKWEKQARFNKTTHELNELLDNQQQLPKPDCNGVELLQYGVYVP
jgi:hypothetical protein